MVVKGSTERRPTEGLQWFNGNVGVRRIHHLNPRISNYRPKECHEWAAALCDLPAYFFRDTLRALGFAPRDEVHGRLETSREAATGGVRP